MKNYDCKQCKVSADRSIFLTNLFKKLSRKGETQSEEATVLSRRLMSARFPTQGSTWDYLVTFRLADGRETELFVTEEVYRTMIPGMNGTLTWQGDELISFE
jgi:hypothetical protein